MRITENHIKKIVKKVLLENYEYENIKNLLYRAWNKLKEKGIEPKLDDLTYGLTNFEKYSEYDMNIIRPIWFEYNGGYNKVYEKFLNDILNYSEEDMKNKEKALKMSEKQINEHVSIIYNQDVVIVTNKKVSLEPQEVSLKRSTLDKIVKALNTKSKK